MNSWGGSRFWCSYRTGWWQTDFHIRNAPKSGLFRVYGIHFMNHKGIPPLLNLPGNNPNSKVKHNNQVCVRCCRSLRNCNGFPCAWTFLRIKVLWKKTSIMISTLFGRYVFHQHVSSFIHWKEVAYLFMCILTETFFIMWKQLCGQKYHRQKPMSSFIKKNLYFVRAVKVSNSLRGV